MKKKKLSFSRSPFFGLENLQDEKMTSFPKKNGGRGRIFSFFFGSFKKLILGC
jgi:hypothetical protein